MPTTISEIILSLTEQLDFARRYYFRPAEYTHDQYISALESEISFYRVMEYNNRCQ